MVRPPLRFLSNRMKHPPIELLESTHTFPGPYLFKLVGENGLLSEASLLGPISQYSTEVKVVGTRLSANGKHISYSIEAQVKNAQAIHDILTALHGVPGLALIL